MHSIFSIYRFTFFVFFLVITPVQAQEDLGAYLAYFQRKLSGVNEKLASAHSDLNAARDQLVADQQLKALKRLGMLHLTQTHDYGLALQNFIEALSIEDSLKRYDQQVYTYLAMSQIFEDVGDYRKADELLQPALRLNDRYRDVNVLVYILNRLGRINTLLGNLEKADESFQLALEYKDQLDYPLMQAEVLYNLAQLEQQQGRLANALAVHKDALAIYRAQGARKNEARSLSVIAQLYKDMENSERMRANHEAALEIRQLIRDKAGIAESFNNLGIMAYDSGNHQKAQALLDSGLMYAQEAHLQEEMRRSYEYLSHCHEAMGNLEQALIYKNRFIAISEYMQNEKNDRQLAEAQNRFELNKKQSQIDNLQVQQWRQELQLAEDKRLQRLLIFGLAVGLLVMVIVYYMYLQKRRAERVLRTVNEQVKEQNRQLADLNATKNKFFSIIGHDLKGPLNSLTSFSGLLMNHTDHLSKEEIQMLAKDLDKSLKNLFALLENLLEWARSQTGSTDFTKESFDLVRVMEDNEKLLSTQARNKHITIEMDCPGGLTVLAHKPSINTVVRNLLSNAIKFTPQGGRIVAKADQRNGQVVVSIEDNGVGIPREAIGKLFRLDAKHSTEGTAREKGTGLGLLLCKEFVEKNGGELWVKSEEGKGSVFSFSLPV
ncbi:MAG: ATP-binding protein [Cyclobacteriaceae bacterium]